MATDPTEFDTPSPTPDPGVVDPPTTDPTATTPTTTEPSGDQFPTFGAGKDKALSVPQNVLQWIQDATDATGIPDVVLAAVIHQRINGRGTSLSPQIVAGVADRIAQQGKSTSDVTWATPGTLARVSDIDWWLNVAANYGSGAAQGTDSWRTYRTLLQGFTTKTPTIAPDISIPAGRRQLASFPGGVGGGYGYGTGAAA